MVYLRAKACLLCVAGDRTHCSQTLVGGLVGYIVDMIGRVNSLGFPPQRSPLS
jgi:hypothetical protein